MAKPSASEGFVSPAPTSRPRWQTTLYRKVKTMSRHPELICISAALLFSICSRLCQSKLQRRLERLPLPPGPFFPPHTSSHILDFPHGQLKEVGMLLSEEETLVVMFYAPWCAESKNMQEDFHRAAKYFDSQVRFVAVNCWFPSGQCRQTNRFMSYPVIYFYHHSLDGFKYSGPLHAEHLIRFIEQLLYPLTYISSPESLAVSLAHNERSVIGYFDLSSQPQSPGFIQFYYAALRTIEQEPNNVIGFSVVTNQDLAKDMNLTKSGDIMLIHFLNESVRYPPERNFTSSAITKWVFSYVQQPSTLWLLPKAAKSLVLSSNIQKGPAFILFTPYYPLAGLNQHATVLHEIALSYHNCRNDSRLYHLLSGIEYSRWDDIVHRLDLLEKCRQYVPRRYKPQPVPTPSSRHCCVTLAVSNRSSACDLCLTIHPTHPRYKQDWCPLLAIEQHLPRPYSCHNHQRTYDPSQRLSLCCDISSQAAITSETTAQWVHNTSIDSYVLEHDRQMCHKMRTARAYGWMPAIQTNVPVDKLVANVSGLGCNINTSLNFFTMDSRTSHMFTERLGVEPISAVIVNVKTEILHVTNKIVDKQSLVDMVWNYSTGSLERHYRSDNTLSACTSEPCIVEVTSSSFQHVVMDDSKDVVLLYYTPFCGFCAGFAHIYLSLAKYFKNSKKIIFARIDGERNDLPWQYTADAYPTIIFFPAHRKSESVAFPDHLKLRAPSLIRFVLTHATRDLKLEAAMASCSGTCIHGNAAAAAQAVQALLSEQKLVERRLSKAESMQQSVNKDDKLSHNEANEQSTVKLSKQEQLHEDYIKYLRERMQQLTASEMAARELRSVLRSTRTQYLEKHKLLAVQKIRNLT